MRLTRRVRLAGVALAASALVLSACGGSDDDSGEATDAIISVNGSEPENPLIPTATNETGGGNPIQNLFAGLVSYNADGSTTNEVAESIESDDATLWTVTLNDGWTFTDGSPVTAESFVNAWNYGADPANAQLNAYFFYPIEGTNDEGNTPEGVSTISGLTVVDDTTFTIKLKKPESDFPLRLGYSAYFPLPEAAFGPDGKITSEYGERPIGNGPYMLSDSGWEHDVQISMVTNPDYDGARNPANGGLTFKFYADLDAAYTDLVGGDLDVLDTVPDSALATFESDDVQAFNEAGSVFQSFTIPESLPHFSGEEGKLRRQAISYAINREEVTDKIFDGTRTPAEDFTAPVLDGWTADVEGNEVLSFDETKAQELWAEADAISPWTGSFQIAYNTDGGHKAWVDATTNQIKNALGIDSSGAPYATFDELRAKVNDKTITTAFRTGWQADYPSMLNYLGPLYGTGAGSNDGDYSNPEFDATIADAASTEGDDRYSLIEDAQAILFTDLPAIPLWYSNIAAAAATDVDNVEFTWQNLPDYYKITK
ncbi:MAG: ABC transporter substrate-binding protein [Aeromicrobium sp.]|uniref:peptide ABC transporter substrate-binding protein n=1 Tax=Aeromicrobium sp. TaxID=1871063 RepID=UPI0025BE7183|nr:ABC transporter substrate-binding protein [Aeromicrobium sp.]MCK5891086.1 ABC transporter substrate-binding protein [Aeromicrobium sp.]MDF1704123.1 ABC transporter substrate-binding protein [Aeromicrobium sp.]